MSYIIKTYDRDKTLYFHRMCRRVYRDTETPAFQTEIGEAYIFDTKERAYRMMAQISERYPEVHLELEEIKAPGLRGEDGYVPLEKTASAMTSNRTIQRIWAEYEQVNTRQHNLEEYAKTLSPDEKMFSLVEEQIEAMGRYMFCILERCKLMGIDLDKVEKTIVEEKE